MTSRKVNNQTYTLGHDAENRLVKACQDTSSNAICDAGESVIGSFVYDGEGARVTSTIGSAITTFVGNHYEVSGSTVTKYYFAGSTRIAMRQGSDLYYLLADHLGSTSLVTDTDSEGGYVVSETRYKPWGETRLTNGTTPTEYTFQGQYSNVADFGLQYFNARWYDGSLGRWASPDSIVPSGVQAWDRYAFVDNNPLRYTDPSGHEKVCIGYTSQGCSTWYETSSTATPTPLARRGSLRSTPERSAGA
jgi:RHS repeat-associated protein